MATASQLEQRLAAERAELQRQQQQMERRFHEAQGELVRRGTRKGGLSPEQRSALNEEIRDLRAGIDARNLRRENLVTEIENASFGTRLQDAFRKGFGSFPELPGLDVAGS